MKKVVSVFLIVLSIFMTTSCTAEADKSKVPDGCNYADIYIQTEMNLFKCKVESAYFVNDECVYVHFQELILEDDKETVSGYKEFIGIVPKSSISFYRLPNMGSGKLNISSKMWSDAPPMEKMTKKDIEKMLLEHTDYKISNGWVSKDGKVFSESISLYLEV